MADTKECTAKQSGPGVTPASGAAAPTLQKAPASGAQSLKPTIPTYAPAKA